MMSISKISSVLLLFVCSTWKADAFVLTTRSVKVGSICFVGGTGDDGTVGETGGMEGETGGMEGGGTVGPSLQDVMNSLSSVEQGIRSEIEGIRSDMGKLETGIRSDMGKLETGIRSDMGGIRRDMGKLETGIRSEIGGLRSDMGRLQEAQLRAEAAKLFGESFSKSYVVKRVDDMIRLVVREGNRKIEPKDATQLIVANAKSMVKPTIEAFVHGFNFSDLDQDTAMKAQNKVGDAKAFLNNGKLYDAVNSLVAAANISDKIAMRHTLERLRMAFHETNHDIVDEANLQLCDGPGVMLLELASRKVKVSAQHNFLVEPLPIEEIQFDMRGTTNMATNFLSVECGEAKSSGGAIPDAIKQCELRTRFVEHAVKTIHPGVFNISHRTARVFVPDRPEIDTSDFDGRIEKSGMSVYVHKL